MNILDVPISGRYIFNFCTFPWGSVQFFVWTLEARECQIGAMVVVKNKDRFRAPVQADAGESVVMKSHPKEFWTTEKDKYIKI